MKGLKENKIPEELAVLNFQKIKLPTTMPSHLKFGITKTFGETVIRMKSIYKTVISLLISPVGFFSVLQCLPPPPLQPSLLAVLSWRA